MNIYELIEYRCDSPGQEAACSAWLTDVVAPVMKRAGVRQVGLFEPRGGDAEGARRLWVLAVHDSMEMCLASRRQMLADPAWAGAPADPSSPDARMYDEVTLSLLRAFASMPDLETPEPASERRYQLRIYESPTVETGQRKIDMFQSGGEIDIFRRVGLAPVFFAEAIAGPRLPNLTYMLSFPDKAAQRAAWGTFIADPAWEALIARPELRDEVIIRNITNIELAALPGSDV